jgi:hypothetical protein
MSAALPGKIRYSVPRETSAARARSSIERSDREVRMSISWAATRMRVRAGGRGSWEMLLRSASRERKCR